MVRRGGEEQKNKATQNTQAASVRAGIPERISNSDPECIVHWKDLPADTLLQVKVSKESEKTIVP